MTDELIVRRERINDLMSDIINDRVTTADANVEVLRLYGEHGLEPKETAGPFNNLFYLRNLIDDQLVRRYGSVDNAIFGYQEV